MFVLSKAVALVRGIEAGLVQIQGDIMKKNISYLSQVMITCLVFSDQSSLELLAQLRAYSSAG
jgi:hypothetical protein